jgi:hypothetical protein
LEVIEPVQKKPCLSFGTSNVLQIPEPEHITVAKALATQLSEVALHNYKYHGKIISKQSSKMTSNDASSSQGTPAGAAFQQCSSPRHWDDSWLNIELSS